MITAVRDFVSRHPVKVRALVAAVLVIVGQFVPQAAELAGSNVAVDAITGALVVALGYDAVRTSKHK